MNFYNEKFEVYLDKLKKLDVSKVFTENISFPEFVQLKLIDHLSQKNEQKSVQVSSLVENSGVTAQAISKCLRILEEKNYIERYSNKSDRRITEVKLTSEGTRVLNVTGNEMGTVFSIVFSDFTQDELDMFEVLVGKFLGLYADAIDKMKIGG